MQADQILNGIQAGTLKIKSTHNSDQTTYVYFETDEEHTTQVVGCSESNHPTVRYSGLSVTVAPGPNGVGGFSVACENRDDAVLIFNTLKEGVENAVEEAFGSRNVR